MEIPRDLLILGSCFNSAQGHDVQQVSIGPTGYLWKFPRYRIARLMDLV
ncbi:hypothetical protein PPTG_24643 [Phytophthora nicotianae INRA-310]|uniref:Uncharacterized protein n=2 Tax=Phytophthora nicotianae TaxID=4792 RepID=W2PBZ2_PHYN3|nr:hypothetical protein PPTG_24643 [Phytophthora nicotianae INRA-310]ETL46393.1 hypothetical protein L916_03716 [Phytophthora nicotianae]ETM98341.1 hypothetical protein PPTG_24643 [Phytophthora nicotianae INRA-310]